MPQSIPPKPPGARRRRNWSPPWTVLETPAGDVEVPEMPKPRKGRRWTAKACAWWSTVWRSAPAQQWGAADGFALERLLQLVDEHARRPLLVGELAHAVQLERELGLSPRARRSLGWQVVEVPPERPRFVELASDVRRRVRAVDPELAKKAEGA